MRRILPPPHLALEYVADVTVSCIYNMPCQFGCATMQTLPSLVFAKHLALPLSSSNLSVHVCGPWQISLDGTISVVAGTPQTSGNEGDGIIGAANTAGTTLLYTPKGMAFDRAGNLYIAMTDGNVIRKVIMNTRIVPCRRILHLNLFIFLVMAWG